MFDRLNLQEKANNHALRNARGFMNPDLTVQSYQMMRGGVIVALAKTAYRNGGSRLSCEAQSQLCSRRHRYVEVKNVLVVLGKQRGRKCKSSSDDIHGSLNNTAVVPPRIAFRVIFAQAFFRPIAT
jgi:hypothetical protein